MGKKEKKRKELLHILDIPDVSFSELSVEDIRNLLEIMDEAGIPNLFLEIRKEGILTNKSFYIPAHLEPVIVEDEFGAKCLAFKKKLNK